MSARLNAIDPLKIGKSATRENVSELMYLKLLAELAMNRFKWTGLPKEIDHRFIELVLYQQALCVFFYDNDYDRYMALRGAGTNVLNMYDNPVDFIVYGNLMINKTLKSGDECIPIWANMLRTPDYETVRLYASRLAELDTSIDIAAMNLRQPTVIVAGEEERMSMKNFVQQRMRGAFKIYVTKNFEASQIQAFPVAGDVRTLEALQLSRSRIWNDCMSMLGIENSNQEKKERLVAGEVEANDAQVVAYKAVALESRRYAAQQINERYGLDVYVEYNTDVEARAQKIEDSFIMNDTGGGSVE